MAKLANAPTGAGVINSGLDSMVSPNNANLAAPAAAQASAFSALGSMTSAAAPMQIQPQVAANPLLPNPAALQPANRLNTALPAKPAEHPQEPTE